MRGRRAAIADEGGALRASGGYTLVELLWVCGLLALLAAIAFPLVRSAIDDGRAYAAVRYLAGRCGEARFEAVKRSAPVGIRFEPASDDYRFQVYVDGNGNGVRARDIARGIDMPTGPPTRLGELFPGVSLALPEALPAIDGTGTTGTDAVQLGSGDVLTYSPLGSATPGTVYVRGPSGQVWAVRVLGDTGRTRLWRFDRRARVWRAY